jgi:membrane dipeptidase
VTSPPARRASTTTVFSSSMVDQGAHDAAHAFAMSIQPQLAALRVKHAGNPAAFEAAEETLWKPFTPVRADWTSVVDHLEHVMRIAPGAAGLGSDFDGADDIPEGLADVASMPRITEELLRRGHSEAEVRGVLGGNFLRFLRRVEKTAADLENEPADATPFAKAP